MDYLLLDRDPRWKKLLGAKRFKQFELSQPRQMRFPYDVVFCDPPFANIALPGKVRALLPHPKPPKPPHVLRLQKLVRYHPIV